MLPEEMHYWQALKRAAWTGCRLRLCSAGVQASQLRDGDVLGDVLGMSKASVHQGLSSKPVSTRHEAPHSFIAPH